MRRLLWSCCALLLTVGARAEALPINTLYSTGFGPDGQLLSGGPDAHYTLLRIDYAGPYTGTFPTLPPPVQSTYVAFAPPMQANVLQYTHPAWVPNSATSRWVSYDGNFGSSFFFTGLYTYQTTFDLTGLDPASVRISGVWGSDDPGWAFLNVADPTVLDAEHLVIPLGGGFGGLPPFEITGANGLFRPGLNTLTFVVWDAGNSVTGLRFEVQAATADRAVRFVPIDIKPGSFPNSINLSSIGTVPVAILSLPDFDAGTVDVSTVTLCNAGVAQKKGGAFMASREDVNGDGLLDLVLHVPTANLVVDPAGGEAVLNGKTVDGLAIQGKDYIKVVP